MPQSPPHDAAWVERRAEPFAVGTGDRPVAETTLAPTSAAVVIRKARPRWLALADQAIVSGTNFCTLLLVGRSSPAEELGGYSAGFTLLVLILGVQQALVCAPLNVFGARLTGGSRRRLAGSSLVHSVVLSLMVGLGLVVASLALLWTAPESGFAPLLAVLALVCPFVLLREFARRFEFAQLRIEAALALDAILAVLQVTALLALALSGRLTAVSAYAALGLASAAVSLAWLWSVRESLVCATASVLADLLPHLRFGRWVLAGTLVTIAHGYLLHGLLLLRWGKSAAGLMAACLSLAHLANPLVLGISNLMGPQAARVRAIGSGCDVRRLVARTAAAMAAIMGLFACGLSLAGAFALSTLFRPEYAGQAVTIAILAWAMFAQAVGMPASEALIAIERPTANLRAGLAGLAAMLLVAWWSLAYGPAGAAVAMLAGNLVTASCRTAAMWRATASEASA